MKPKLGIDMDEVIAHFLPAFIEFHNQTYQTNLKISQFHSYQFWEVINETPKESIQKVYAFHKTPYFKNIQPLNDALIAIPKLKQQYELTVITSRQKDVQKQTEQWIEKHFPNMFSGIYFSNHNTLSQQKQQSKSEICEQLGIQTMIEDCLEYAEDCAQKNIQVFLINKPWNQSENKSKHIQRVSDWSQIIDALLGDKVY
jgi:uncharacterized HAD superfamily protein